MAAPFYIDPNARFAKILDRFGHIQLCHLNDQILKLCFDLLRASFLFVIWHSFNLHDALDRATLKLILAILRIFVYLKLSFQLIVQLAEQIDRPRYS